jgi:hypothetical protein
MCGSPWTTTREYQDPDCGAERVFRPLVLGRFFYFVDNEDVHGSLSGLQLQPELLLHGGE